MPAVQSPDLCIGCVVISRIATQLGFLLAPVPLCHVIGYIGYRYIGVTSGVATGVARVAKTTTNGEKSVENGV